MRPAPTCTSSFPVSTSAVLSLQLLMLLAASVFITADAATDVQLAQHDEQRHLSDQLLTIQVLEDLIERLRSELPNDSIRQMANRGEKVIQGIHVIQWNSINKRQFDGGYGSRYVAAHNVGSKLMALKQAADWNSPGKKRRSVTRN